MNFGFTPSVLDGTEHQFTEFKNLEMPSKYTYLNFLSPVLNQGNEPICVPCSISAHLNWNINVDTTGENHNDHQIKLKDIYKSKTSGGDGMSFKDALHFLRHTGVGSNAGLLTIDKYAMIRTPEQLKQALLLNGPCIAGLPVYNYSFEFWNEEPGDKFQGGHAISIVGYDEQGFIIRNSWGTKFGDQGYTRLRYENFSKIMEAWTIID